MHGVVNRQLISTTFQTPHSFHPNDVLISPLSQCASGDEITATGTGAIASGTYPASSRVLAYPIELADYFLVQKFWWISGTTGGTDSADAGIYNEAGTVLLSHSGSTAITGSNDTFQATDPADVLVGPGRYWVAYVQGGTTATPTSVPSSAAGIARINGWAQMAGSGSTLGSTFTPAAIAGTVFPYFGFSGRVFT
jgi:hypothetical protein